MASDLSVSLKSTTEYLLYNTVTHETITLCDYDDAECIAALQADGFYMLSPETYGDDAYAYPAIYKSPGIVWDQSEERTTNGDWMMTSREVEAADSGDHSHGDDHSHGGSDGGDVNIDTTEYFLYNSVTHETVTLCGDDDAECIAALQADGFYMLSSETYGEDAYAYPAIYKSPGIVWDQSEDRTTNGDWTMMSRELEVVNADDQSNGDDDADSDTTENPMYVTYNDGRRNNTGMGLYYLGGTHEIGLAPHGMERGETPSKFIPLWMSDSMDIMSDLPSFPRPGGAMEGVTTGIVEYKGKTHVVYENKKGNFKKISFEISDGNGIASGGEKRAKDKWINKVETKKAVDINGDGVFGDLSDQTDGLSEGEYNDASFDNKVKNDKKLLKKLQKGGMVIYLRHTTTEVDYADQADPNMSLDDCSTQRMLNAQGIAEAEAIGAGFEANDILIGKVISSEYCRAKDTATIAFGGFDETNENLNFLPFEDYTDEQLDTYHDRVAPMLSQNVESGNKIIVGHDDPFEGTTNIYPDPQGTAYIIEPNNGDSFEIIARLEPNDWAFSANI